MVELLQRHASESRLNAPQLPGLVNSLLRNRPRGSLPSAPGFHLPQFDEPVDPTDCGKWFDSPFCAGNPPINPIGFSLFAPFAQQKLNPQIRIFPTGIGIRDFGINNCQAWICIGGSVLGVSGPPFCFNYNAPNCRLPDPPQAPQAIPGLGAALRPPFQESPFADGWIRDCQYLVTITSPGGHGEPLLRNGWINSFDRFGQLGDGDHVFSAWGPIVGLEHRYVGTTYRNDFTPVYMFDLYLHCRGLGVWSMPELRRQGLSYRPYSLSNAVSFVLGMQQERSVFLSPNMFQYDRGYLEMWINSPGVYFTRPLGAVEFSDDVRPCYLFTTYAEAGQPIAWSFYDVRKAHRIEPYVFPSGEIANLGTICPLLPPPPPPPPLPRRNNPNMPCSCCSCDEIARIVDAKLVRLYKILGFGVTGPIKAIVQPEQDIKAFGDAVYSKEPPQSAEASNVPKLLAAMLCSQFYRSGLQKYPGNLPESLTEDNNDGQITVRDVTGLHEWMIRSIDALHGAYPIKLKIKDSEGKDTTIKIDNAAEAMAEMIGLLFTIHADTDYLQGLLFKTATEAIGARMAATTASDYAAANADFLGYRSKEVESDIKLTISPGAKNLHDALQPSVQKIKRFKIDDRSDLMEYLKRILLSAEIIKAVFSRKYSDGDLVPGDQLKKDIDADGVNDDAAWVEFIASIENPPEGQKDPTDPQVNIRNLHNQATDHE